MFFLVMNLVVSRFSIQAQDLTLSVNYFAFENKKHSEYSSDVEYSSINKEENILSKEKNLVQPKQFNLIVMYESDALWA
jgi:predicted RND superfamily exporter protein